MKPAGILALILFYTMATAGAVERHAPPVRAQIASRHLAVVPCGAAGCLRSYEVAAEPADDPTQVMPEERTVFLQRSGSTVIVTSLGRKGPDKSRRIVVLEDGSATVGAVPCPELVIC
jgi:hypothetical protein